MDEIYSNEILSDGGIKYISASKDKINATIYANDNPF
jgi:hypothetical protein